MKFQQYKILYIAGLFLLIVASIFVIMNFSYFWKQIKFKINGPQSPQIQDSAFTDQEKKGEPNQIFIPSLGIIAPIVESDQSNEKAFQEALQKGVVHYPGSAFPGQVGNMYIFGHSSDFAFKGGDYKTVFALLPSIKNEAEITITDKDGQKYNYKVFNQFVAKKTDVHLLDQNTKGRKILTLQTSYPIGTALQRYIVQAELIKQ